MLGLIDTTFLAVYAVGLYGSGAFADRHDRREVIASGLLLSGLISALFALSAYLGIQSLVVYAGLWGANGLVQSVGWPACVAVMGEWFVGRRRGWVFGMWTSTSSVGNLVGTGVMVMLLQVLGDRDGWKAGMLVVGLLMIAQAACIYLCLPAHPVHSHVDPISDPLLLPGRDPSPLMPSDEGTVPQLPPKPVEDHPGQVSEPYERMESEGCTMEVGIREGGTLEGGTMEVGTMEGGTEGSSEDLGHGAEDGRRGATKHGGGGESGQAISFCGAFLIPGVLPYSLCYAFLKGTKYTFLFWLPTYLNSAMDVSGTRADLLSMLFDVGAIGGAAVVGAASDRLSSRGPLTISLLLSSLPVTWYMQFASLGQLVPLLLVVGAQLGAPANLVAGCISADLGQHQSLHGKQRALATVTGIIDGTGSLGAAAAQYIVGILAPGNGTQAVAGAWSRVFMFLLVCTACSVVCLLPVLRVDFVRAAAAIRGGARSCLCGAC